MVIYCIPFAYWFHIDSLLNVTVVGVVVVVFACYRTWKTNKRI